MDNSGNRGDVTLLLARWHAGDADACEALMNRTYAELRRLARALLRRERPGHTLQATALVNEACLRLLPGSLRSAENRDAFFRIVTGEMRRRLVDHARRRLAVKRGAGAIPRSLDTSTDPPAPAVADDTDAMLDRLDEAVERLERLHPRAARVAQLRFFGGMTNDQAAEELGVSSGTVKREWTFAKAWLAAALEGHEPPDT